MNLLAASHRLSLACLWLCASFACLFHSTPSAVAAVFSNAATIVINDSSHPPTPATPWPSVITVSGRPDQLLRRITVRLSGLTHSFPDDLSVILAGPRGQRAVLMSNIGGDLAVTNVTLAFDSETVEPLPLFGQLQPGTFAPSTRIPSLLPADLSGPSGSDSVAVFKNSDPNGDWKLYVADTGVADAGVLLGWQLEFGMVPRLDIKLAGNSIIVSWPATPGFKLETTSQPGNSSSWNPVPSNTGEYGWLVVTNTVSQLPAFYRLQQEN